MADVVESTVTGWCRYGQHGQCIGKVLTGTGWNWWCTCQCHPEPSITNAWPGSRAEQALAFWRAHREG